jgi:kynurenine 3-monooxygenase
MTVAFPNLDGSFTFSVFMPAEGELSFGAVTNTQELEEFFRHNCPQLESLTSELAPDFFNRPPASLASAACAPWNFGGWVTLIGDSAHALVPFLGQGLNCGLEDCTELMELLDRLGPDWRELLPAFEEVRSVNCSAAIRLAEQHFDELANKARDPLFVTRKALEGKAHRLAPERFIPLYSRVAFGDEPYSVVERARISQEAVLDRLMLLPDISCRWDDPDVEELLLAELDRIGPRRESNPQVRIARVR